jgi:hypothetical protein
MESMKNPEVGAAFATTRSSHSPWQRGSNENTNGPTLDWKTPAEALNELLSNPPTVASTA